MNALEFFRGLTTISISRREIAIVSKNYRHARKKILKIFPMFINSF